MLTAEKIDDVLSNFGEGWWSGYNRLMDELGDGEQHEIPKVGKVRLVDSFGGEGQGDEYWMVIEVEMADSSIRLFKKPGYYQSFDGGHYDGDLFEVRAKVVERTIYVAVNE